MQSATLLQGGFFLFALLVSLSVHEWAHAWSAVRLGDPTPREAGRLSLNPLRHLDPLGTAMLAFLALSGVGVGWAKPVPLSPWNFSRPRRDILLVSLAGPLSNLLLALFSWSLFSLLARSTLFQRMDLFLQHLCFGVAGAMLMVNISLFLFNMLPIAPLDGHRFWVALLPPRSGAALEAKLRKWGMTPLMILLLLEWLTPIRPLSSVLVPLVKIFVGAIRAIAHL